MITINLDTILSVSVNNISSDNRIIVTHIAITYIDTMFIVIAGDVIDQADFRSKTRKNAESAAPIYITVLNGHPPGDNDPNAIARRIPNGKTINDDVISILDIDTIRGHCISGIDQDIRACRPENNRRSLSARSNSVESRICAISYRNSISRLRNICSMLNRCPRIADRSRVSVRTGSRNIVSSGYRACACHNSSRYRTSTAIVIGYRQTNGI
ncbi:MAG: hypothetical protein A4E56_01839 [Pelotomaculum sp. PtaU1.Bin065]|nr:MAG: hypothetical protein A4E56_01839 [Pelotomaculum sp. PtaU1.Bin065]